MHCHGFQLVSLRLPPNILLFWNTTIQIELCRRVGDNFWRNNRNLQLLSNQENAESKIWTAQWTRSVNEHTLNLILRNCSPKCYFGNPGWKRINQKMLMEEFWRENNACGNCCHFLDLWLVLEKSIFSDKLSQKRSTSYSDTFEPKNSRWNRAHLKFREGWPRKLKIPKEIQIIEVKWWK